MEDEPPVEVQEKVLSPCLGPLHRRAAELIDPATLAPQRAPGVRHRRICDRLAAQRLLQGPGGAVDGVAFGHASRLPARFWDLRYAIASLIQQDLRAVER